MKAIVSPPKPTPTTGPAEKEQPKKVKVNALVPRLMRAAQIPITVETKVKRSKETS
jgi:hypothetical protein